MSNSLGLTLVGLFVGGIVVLVIGADYVEKKYPDSWLGKVGKGINQVIARSPDDD